jgi:hypothetical protein
VNHPAGISGLVLKLLSLRSLTEVAAHGFTYWPVMGTAWAEGILLTVSHYHGERRRQLTACG